jgi:uracil-DNA glycosylase
LSEQGLIEYDSLEKYLDDEFYSDFVLTDVVKYRVSTSEIDGSRGGNAEASYETFLNSELDALDPDLIFSFGSRCWQVLYRNLDLEPVDPEDVLTDTVTNSHGYAFEYDDGYVIPLTHFSGRNTFLRNSYYEYLQSGIESFTSARS